MCWLLACPLLPNNSNAQEERSEWAAATGSLLTSRVRVAAPMYRCDGVLCVPEPLSAKATTDAGA